MKTNDYTFLHVQFLSQELVNFLVVPDPDGPRRAETVLGEIIHWMVTNIPGCDIDKGEEFAAFVGSGAPCQGLS